MSRKQVDLSGESPLHLRHCIAALLLGLMATIAFLNVLSRYLFHASIAFTEEITITLFVYLTVIGSGIAFERCSHLGMISLYRRFPAMIRKSVAILSGLLAAILFVVVDIMLIRTIYFEVTLFKARSSALNVPIWIYYAIVPVLSVSVFKGIYAGTRESVSSVGCRVSEEADRKME